MYKIKIRESQTQISRLINREIKKLINNALVSAAPSIQARIGSLIESAIKQSPEYDAIINSDFRGELGVVNPGPALDRMIEILKEWVNIQIVKKNQLSISILREGYENISSDPIFEQRNYGPAKGILPWLYWLLVEGDNTAVTILDANITTNTTHGLGAPTPNSRTGIYSMRRGKFWTVPSQYSGTITDNFITRSILPLMSDFESVIMQEIERAI